MSRPSKCTQPTDPTCTKITEIEQDGAANWDNDFRMMLAALDDYTSAGAPLTAVESDELRGHIRTLRGGRGPEESTRALVRLAVTWVLRNPQPLPARAAHYCR